MRLVMVMTLVGILGLAVPVSGDVFHNGTVDSTPPGSGMTNIFVNVDQSGAVWTIFGQLGLFALYADFDPGGSAMMLGQVVVNNTSSQWVGFQVALEDSEFYDFSGNLIPSVDPLTTGGTYQENKIEFVDLGGVSVLTAGIDRSHVEQPLLTILFDDLVAPGESFGFAFIAQDVGMVELGATTFQQALVPEPASLFLLGLGLVAVLRRRR